MAIKTIGYKPSAAFDNNNNKNNNNNNTCDAHVSTLLAVHGAEIKHLEKRLTFEMFKDSGHLVIVKDHTWCISTYA